MKVEDLLDTTSDTAGANHTDQESMFKTASYFWSVYIRNKLHLESTHGINCLGPEDVAMMMALFRVSQTLNGLDVDKVYADLLYNAAKSGEFATEYEAI